jgi:hypothetical protein
LDKGLSLESIKNNTMLSDLKYIIDSNIENKQINDLINSLYNRNDSSSIESYLRNKDETENELIQSFNSEINKLITNDIFHDIIFYETDGKGQRFCSYCLLIKVVLYNPSLIEHITVDIVKDVFEKWIIIAIS